MIAQILINVYLDNGLFPNSTNPLPSWTNVTYPQMGSVALTFDQFHKQFARYQFMKLEKKHL